MQNCVLQQLCLILFGQHGLDPNGQCEGGILVLLSGFSSMCKLPAQWNKTQEWDPHRPLRTHICTHDACFGCRNPPSHCQRSEISTAHQANTMQSGNPTRCPPTFFSGEVIGICPRCLGGIVSARLSLSPPTQSHAPQHLFVCPSAVPYYNTQCRLFEGRDCIFSTSG